MEYMQYLADYPLQIMDAMAFRVENIPNFIALMFCGTFGYLLYVQGIRVLLREKTDPYPLYMHCWMITFDILGAITSWALAIEHDWFWMFTLFALCVPIWVVMEAYCIWYGIKHESERALHFEGLSKNGVISEKKAWFISLGMIALCFCFNLFAMSMVGGIENGAYWLFNAFSNYVFALWTWRYWTKRSVATGTRFGNSMGLQWIITIQITLMWVPGLSWNLALTQYFHQPLFYLCGVAMTCLAAYNLYQCSKLPNKEDRLPNGKKPIW